MKMRKLLSLLGLLLLLCGSGWAQYTFKVIDPPTGGRDLYISSINNAGRMVGGYYVGEESKPVKIDAAGRFLPLVVPNCKQVGPVGLNNKGDISGTCTIANGQTRAFILFRNGAVKINKITGAVVTYGGGLNDFDTRVGTFTTFNPEWPGPQDHGFIVTNSGKLTTVDFPPPPHGEWDPGFTHDTRLAAINNKGQLAGNCEIWAGESRLSGFFMDQPNKLFVELAGPAVSMNNLGEVVGYQVDYPESGYIWYQGQYTNIVYPGAAYTSLTAINDLGQLAGWASDGVNSFAFVATPAE